MRVPQTELPINEPALGSIFGSQRGSPRGMVLARMVPWAAPDITVAEHLAGAASFAWLAVRPAEWPKACPPICKSTEPAGRRSAACGRVLIPGLNVCVGAS